MSPVLLQPLHHQVSCHRHLRVLLDLHVHHPHRTEPSAHQQGGPDKRVRRDDPSDHSARQSADDGQVVHHSQEPTSQGAAERRAGQQEGVAAHHRVRGHHLPGALVPLLCQHNRQTADEERLDI